MTEQSIPFTDEDPGTGHADHAKHHEVFNAGIIIVLILLMVYMLFEASKHKYGLTFGHEASLVCLTGLAVSACMQWMGVSEFHNLMKFNDDLFFYFVLPPIVFASGFNMYRKKFFANIQNIVLFGVIGTFIAFGSFSGLTILYCKLFGLKQYTWDDESNAWLETTLNL